MKKLLVSAFAAMSLMACGSSQLKVHSLDSGPLSVRVANLMESFFALAAQSNSSEEAAQKIDTWCAKEADNIARMKAEGDALEEGSAEAAAHDRELAERGEKIFNRLEDAFKGKEHVVMSVEVVEAMKRCAPFVPAPSGGAEE